MVGELLALALVLTDTGLQHFNWVQLGMVSFLVQWIVLSSAALLCPLRSFLSRHSSLIAGSLSYALVLVVTLIFSVLGQWVLSPIHAINPWQLLDILLLSAIFAGIGLRYSYLQQQLHNQQQAELSARIQALQSRIRPHFLFNSMNSIASLIETDPKTAEKMVEDLSELFRASLADSGLVTVAEELELCRRYVCIEQLRMGDRLSVDWKVGDYPAATKIPSLLLQPLLENAIYHGIQPLPKGGCVDVTVGVEHDRLILEVRNPITENENHKAKSGNQVALDNIRHRLMAHFGATAFCRTGVQEGSYVTRISYPL